MALRQFNPVTPSLRGTVLIDRSELWKGKPLKGLTEGQHSHGGRNNHGRITTRFRGGGHKQAYRVIDFKRRKFDVAAVVERLEYDPNRTAFIALIKYADGELAYIIAPQRLKVGDSVVAGARVDIKPGNAMPLRNVPVGSTICCVEIMPGKGAQLARSAGTSIQLLAREGDYAQLRLRSGEIRRVHVNCCATLGEVGNEEHSLESIGKAGRVRWRGVRPTVRGVAMNPIDHPHGGGEGRTAAAQAPVSPWGVMCKGYKTRKVKRTNSMIVRRRHAKVSAG